MNDPVVIIGAGLAGCEAALQLASRGLRVRLFEMKPADPTAIVTAIATLAVAAAIASLVPARRAARIDPVTALRHE